MKDTIETNLCFYDRRNPDFLIKEEYGYDKEEVDATGNFARKECSCDNCFYRRSKLAEQLILKSDKVYSKQCVLNILESLVEYPTKPGYKRRDIIEFIEKFKKK